MANDRVYKIVFNVDSKILSQLEWANLNMHRKRKNFINIKKGQILKYKSSNNENSIKFLLALEDSSIKKNDVVICPLEIDDERKFYFKQQSIGIIQEIDLRKEIYTQIENVQRINKDDLIDHGISDFEIIAEVHEDITNSIIKAYKEFLTRIVSINYKRDKKIYC